jgi:hypothetical protein
LIATVLVFSSPATDAGVVNATLPPGMLPRCTSVPLRYTTAPSSYNRVNVRLWNNEGSETLNVLRKYVVMYLAPLLGPKLTTVASSPSP